MSKSVIYTAMTTPTNLVIGDTLPVGSTIRRFGSNIRQDGDSIVTTGRGYFKITVSAIVEPAGAGTVTLELNKDGVPVVGARASETVAATDTLASLSIVAVVRNMCECDSAVLSLVLKDGNTALNDLAIVIEKI